MSYVNFYAHHQYHPHQRRASIITTVSTSSSPPSTPTSFTRPSSSVSTESVLGWYQSSGIHSLDDLHDRNFDLVEWARSKPLSILQLDPADRAVLKIAGKLQHDDQFIAIFLFHQYHLESAKTNFCAQKMIGSKKEGEPKKESKWKREAAEKKITIPHHVLRAESTVKAVTWFQPRFANVCPVMPTHR